MGFNSPCMSSADRHTAQNATGVRSSVTNNNPVAVNAERPTATADSKIRYSGSMSFRFGAMTRSKASREIEAT